MISDDSIKSEAGIPSRANRSYEVDDEETLEEDDNQFVSRERAERMATEDETREVEWSAVVPLRLAGTSESERGTETDHGTKKHQNFSGS